MASPVRRRISSNSVPPATASKPAIAVAAAEADAAVPKLAKPWDHEVKAWREETARLRQRLNDHKSRLLAQLHEVEAALSELPSEDGRGHITPPTSAAASAPRPPTFFIPPRGLLQQILRCIGDAGSEGATAAEIMEWLKAHAKREVAPKNFHSYVYRLTQTNRIKAIGPKGSRRYVLPSNAQEAPAMSE